MSLGAPLPPRNWSRGPHSGKQETLMVSERATHWLALFKSEEEDREREGWRGERRREMTPMGLEDKLTYLG